MMQAGSCCIAEKFSVMINQGCEKVSVMRNQGQGIIRGIRARKGSTMMRGYVAKHSGNGQAS